MGVLPNNQQCGVVVSIRRNMQTPTLGWTPGKTNTVLTLFRWQIYWCRHNINDKNNSCGVGCVTSHRDAVERRCTGSQWKAVLWFRFLGNFVQQHFKQARDGMRNPLKRFIFLLLPHVYWLWSHSSNSCSSMETAASWREVGWTENVLYAVKQLSRHAS